VSEHLTMFLLSMVLPCTEWYRINMQWRERKRTQTLTEATAGSNWSRKSSELRQ